MSYMSAEERYTRDPLFHALVDMMFHHINDLQLTPTEMREAAMLACVKFEQMNPRPLIFDPRTLAARQSITGNKFGTE